MNKKIFMALSTAILLFSAAVFTNEIIQQDSAAETVIKQERHVSRDAGYSIEFPPEWEVMKGVMGTDVIALSPTKDPEDLFRENVNVIYAQLESPITREEYYSLNLRSLAQLLVDFDLEKSEDVKFGDVEAKKIIFTHTMGVVNAKVLQYLILDGDKAYVMTFTADPLDFDKILPTFEQVANSFKYEKEKI
jgi:serine/threonine-protein kinase